MSLICRLFGHRSATAYYVGPFTGRVYAWCFRCQKVVQR